MATDLAFTIAQQIGFDTCAPQKLLGAADQGGFLYSVISMREYTVDCSEVWTTRPVVETARSLLI